MKTRHPLHPSFAHFPIALWTASMACDAAALGLENAFWWQAGFWSLLLGFLLAIPTVLSGFLEMSALKPDNPAASTVIFHMALMTVAGMLFFLSLLVRDGMEAPIGKALFIALGSSALGFVLLIIGGWFAGDLVYRYGIGARRPASEEEGEAATE
jgi:uncharacterized membrane protein